MTNPKRNVLALLNAFIIPSVFAQVISLDVALNNSLPCDRKDCPVVIDLSDFNKSCDISRAVVTSDGAEISSQLDDFDNDGVPDELCFVIDMSANESKKLIVDFYDEGVQAEYPLRVWSGFMLRGPKKDQYADVNEVSVPGHVNFYNNVYGHGPMFESELVGYRVYFNQKQTLDPYGKFQKRLELIDTKFYPTDDHLAQGYGDDVLLAGNSCGVGAFKGWNGTNATHIEPVKSRTERILASGPVRVIVEAEVDDWDYQGHKLDMINRYTLYAGHRDLKVDAKFRQPLSDQTFATGVERIMGNETVSYSDPDGLVVSWGRHWPVTDTVKFAKETIGIGTYVPRKYIVEATEDPDNFLFVVSAPGEKEITYYTSFTSRKETFGFEDFDSWVAYLKHWRELLDNPLEITVTKVSE